MREIERDPGRIPSASSVDLARHLYKSSSIDTKIPPLMSPVTSQRRTLISIPQNVAIQGGHMPERSRRFASPKRRRRRFPRERTYRARRSGLLEKDPAAVARHARAYKSRWRAQLATAKSQPLSCCCNSGDALILTSTPVCCVYTFACTQRAHIQTHIEKKKDACLLRAKEETAALFQSCSARSRRPIPARGRAISFEPHSDLDLLSLQRTRDNGRALLRPLRGQRAARAKREKKNCGRTLRSLHAA